MKLQSMTRSIALETAPLVSDKQRISQLDFDLNLETAVFLIKKKNLKDQASCICD
jgi:hypothetical protein